MNKTEKSCGAVIVSGDEYLLVQHRAGHWDFPKGHVEPGEKEEETAKREVFEETGIKLRIFDNFKTEINYYPKEGILKTVVYFVGFSESKKVKMNEREIINFKWMKYADASKQLTYENAREVLRKAHGFLNA